MNIYEQVIFDEAMRVLGFRYLAPLAKLGINETKPLATEIQEYLKALKNDEPIEILGNYSNPK